MGQDNDNIQNTEVVKKAKQHITLPGYLWIASMAALGAWIAVMASDRQLPTEYVGKPQVIPDPVEDGARIIVDIPVKRNRSCPGTVQRMLKNARTDEVIAFYDPVAAAYPTPIGSEQRLPKTFELPEGLPPRVMYSAEVCFTCNIIQHWWPICTHVPSVTFSVITKRR